MNHHEPDFSRWSPPEVEPDLPSKPAWSRDSPISAASAAGLALVFVVLSAIALIAVICVVTLPLALLGEAVGHHPVGEFYRDMFRGLNDAPIANILPILLLAAPIGAFVVSLVLWLAFPRFRQQRLAIRALVACGLMYVSGAVGFTIFLR